MHTATIRNNATGEVRTVALDIPFSPDSEWWWTDGNMACDCNRVLEFERAAGIEPDDPEPPEGTSDDEYEAFAAQSPLRCGSERFSLLKLEGDGGFCREWPDGDRA